MSPPVLLQVLYPRAGRMVVNSANGPGDTHASETPMPALSGYSDSDHATVDRDTMTWTGDPNEIDGDVDYYVCHSLDLCTAPGAIDHVRFVGESRIVSGHPSSQQFVTPSVNCQNDAGLDQVNQVVVDGWGRWSFQRPTYAAAMGGAGQVWTPALINSLKFGYHLGPVFYSLIAFAEVAEFHLEVWGTPVTTPRPDAQLNRVVEGVIYALEQMRDNQLLYRTGFQTIGRMWDPPGDQGVMLPCIMVELTGETSDGYSTEKHESWADIVLHACTQDADQPERVLIEAAADIKRAMLEGVAETLAFRRFAVLEVIYTGMSLMMDPESKRGIATLRFRVHFTWSHAAP